MEQTQYQKMLELTDRLNRYRDEYYNKTAPSVSDEVYDRLLEELAELEMRLCVQMSNSPTLTVGYKAVSKLEKTKHTIPLLSLDKTKRTEDLFSFMGNQQVMLMLKLDGLTVKLTYEYGGLVEAATRGDGDEGEIITHNVRGITGIPQNFFCQEKRLVVVGEAFIRPNDFECMKSSLVDSTGKPYRNGRNLAAGSVRLLDAAACKERRVTFMPFNVLEGLDGSTKSEKLFALREYGFQPCKFLLSREPLTRQEINEGTQFLRKYAKDNDIPIDGIVMTYNDIAYSKSCGRTGHHYKDGIAFKFEDDLHETKLQQIEWTPTRTGEIAPVAVFAPVEIDGCQVSRASLHNLSFIEGLDLMPGNRVLVSKRNMIIPQVEENLDRGGFDLDAVIPHQCPCCGKPTRVHVSDNGTKSLFCDNDACETRRLRQFVHIGEVYWPRLAA